MYWIWHTVSVLDRQELEEKLRELLQALIKQGYHGDRQLSLYLSADIPDFAAVLLHAARYDCMSAVL